MKLLILLSIFSLLPACSAAVPPPLRHTEAVVPAIPANVPTTSSSASPLSSPPPPDGGTPHKAATPPATASPQAIRIPKAEGRAAKAPGKKPTQKGKAAHASTGATDKAVVKQQVEQSVQRPLNSMSLESKTIYSYVPDAIYLIYAALNHVVDVQLQPGETLTGKIVAGDTHRWAVGTVTDGSGAKTTIHVLIKPKQAGIETNFLIVTDRHSYRLYAQSNDDFFIPTVGWAYPEEEMVQAMQIKKEQQRLDGMVAAPAIVAAQLNFRYRVKPDGRYPWTPLRAFDDGSKTYIQMSPDMKSGEAPVFFIREGKDLNLVNYRIRGDYYVVDRLFQEAELRSGKKDRVRIIKDTSWSSSGEDLPEPGKMGRR